MTFVAGWAETLITNKDAESLIQNHIDNSQYFQKNNIKVESSDFYLIATEQVNLSSNHNTLLINAGNAQPNDFDQQILKDYQQKGEFFLDSNVINQAIVIIDPSQKRLILATDPIGKTHLYYSITAKGLVFGNSADNVIAHPEVSSEISTQSIYDYVYFHHCPSPNTIYKEVKKLEGGQVLVYQNGKVTIRYYWRPEFLEDPISIQQKGVELKENINRIVKDQAGAVDETGAFLSGGLDSSTVAGALSKVFPGEAKTFTIGFPVEGYDETEYARIAVNHFNTQANEYYVTPEDTVSAIPNIAAFYDEPFGNSSALAAYYCAKFAKETGIKTLLAGDAGDELFAGNERYATQLLFEKYYQIPGVLRSMLKTGLYNAPEYFLKNKIIFKAKRYVEQAEVHLPDRMQDYNFLNRHPVNEVFSEYFLESVNVNLPIEELRDCYNRPDHASSLNRMLYMDWKITLHDNDLVKVNKMCEMAGVDVQYPLLDQSIINLSCQIPSTEKLKGQKLRWFYKQAMQDFLPEQILNKSKHGFGLPFGIWLKDHQPLKELAYDSIKSLNRRGYFREEFLNHAIKMHQSIHAAYYGELIWILMMLELWIQAKKH